jgi:alkylhydroperoxidase family enzyme
MPLPSPLQDAIDALLGQPGTTDSKLRQVVLEHARSGDGQVPEVLCDFVEKIAARPWTVSDEDFARLRDAGFSDDQLYELTLACALGAGLQRFDAGLRALEEAV